MPQARTRLLVSMQIIVARAFSQTSAHAFAGKRKVRQFARREIELTITIQQFRIVLRCRLTVGASASAVTHVQHSFGRAYNWSCAGQHGRCIQSAGNDIRMCTTWTQGSGVQEKVQSAPTPPVGSQHSCQPTVKLHILPLVWVFPLGKG